MIACNILGCACQGTGQTNGHTPIKAWRYGYIYYAASYGPRYAEPTATFVSLIVGRADDAAENAAFFERKELGLDCEGSPPDVCTWGESTYAAKDLFTPAELREHRRDLLAGKVVCLSR